MCISSKLKKLRKSKGVGQKEIANSLNITVGAYSNYEQGTRLPNAEIIVKLCKYFECTADYLLGLSDY